MEDRQAHWQNVYTTKSDTDVSWYEKRPQLSLSLIRDAGLELGMSVIDIGGGASRLVDMLVSEQQDHVTVLDLSSAALELAVARLPASAHVSWIVSDITAWMPDRQYDFWHDRAAFHFLTMEADKQAYVRVLQRTLKVGGKAVLGTFAKDGPEKCSGLQVTRYDASGLQATLGKSFKLVSWLHHQHSTPPGAVQNFLFCTFQKT